MVKSTEIMGLPIFTLTEGREIGKVKDFIIDPQKVRLFALLVEPSGVVNYSSVKSIGENAIIVDSAQQITDISENEQLEQRQEIRITNTKVITSKGKLIGNAIDFFFDPTTGKILGCEIGLSNHPDERLPISSARIVSLGKDAIIITEEEIEMVPPKKDVEKTEKETPQITAETEEGKERVKTILEGLAEEIEKEESSREI